LRTPSLLIPLVQLTTYRLRDGFSHCALSWICLSLSIVVILSIRLRCDQPSTRSSTLDTEHGLIVSTFREYTSSTSHLPPRLLPSCTIAGMLHLTLKYHPVSSPHPICDTSPHRPRTRYREPFLNLFLYLVDYQPLSYFSDPRFRLSILFLLSSYLTHYIPSIRHLVASILL